MDTVSTSPSLQKTLLRLIQQEKTIERSVLGLRSRSYDPENWDAVLTELLERGLITEDAQIRVGVKSRRQQRRAVIVYRLSPPLGVVPIMGGGIVDVTNQATSWPDFANMSVEEVALFVAKFPRRETVAVAVNE